MYLTFHKYWTYDSCEQDEKMRDLNPTWEKSLFLHGLSFSGLYKKKTWKLTWYINKKLNKITPIIETLVLLVYTKTKQTHFILVSLNWF